MIISPEETTATQTILEGSENQAGPFVAGAIQDNEYARIGEILHETQNFALAGYKEHCVKRRIAARIRTLGMAGAAAYIALLESSRTEQQELLSTVSVHVSHFFRNPSTFSVLEKRVLPELVGRASRSGEKVRFWSVGCSNGEEPYSLALLGQKVVANREQLAIIGTDLSREALSFAKRGCYEESRLREVPKELLNGYFVSRNQHYCLADEIKKQVRFYRHDILRDRPFSRVELILCRNVLIYFSRWQQAQVLARLSEALQPGGYLVLGRAETLVSSCREQYQCIDPAERIYQRLRGDEENSGQT